MVAETPITIGEIPKMNRKFARFGGAAMAATLLALTACNASDTKSATAQSATSWTEFRFNFLADRQRVESGKIVSVRVDLGGRRIIKKKQQRERLKKQEISR